MNPGQLPLYALFHRLRKEAGIELDARQYYAFLKSFTSLEAISEARQLLELCKIHWLSRPRHEREFEQLFREEFLKEAAALFEAKAPVKEPLPRPKPEPAPPETETPPPQERPEETPAPAKEPPVPPRPAEPLPEGQDSSIYIHFKAGGGQKAGAGKMEAGHSAACSWILSSSAPSSWRNSCGKRPAIPPWHLSSAMLAPPGGASTKSASTPRAISSNSSGRGRRASCGSTPCPAPAGQAVRPCTCPSLWICWRPAKRASGNCRKN